MEYVIGLVVGGAVFLIGFMCGYGVHNEAKEIVQLALNDRKKHLELLERRTVLEQELTQSVRDLTRLVRR